MSCIMLTTRAHAAMAETIADLLNLGFNSFGFSAPDTLYKALNDCRNIYGEYSSAAIYDRLYSLNAAAYNGRYANAPHIPDAAPVPDMPDIPPLRTGREFTDDHEKILPWHYHLCKLLDCLIYQASEDVTAKDPLFLALVDFSRAYTTFLVSNAQAYNTFPWGDI